MPDPDRKVDAWARRIVAEAGTTDTLKVMEVDDARDQAGIRLRRAP